MLIKLTEFCSGCEVWVNPAFVMLVEEYDSDAPATQLVFSHKYDHDHSGLKDKNRDYEMQVCGSPTEVAALVNGEQPSRSFEDEINSGNPMAHYDKPNKIFEPGFAIPIKHNTPREAMA